MSRFVDHDNDAEAEDRDKNGNNGHSILPFVSCGQNPVIIS
jgi:hypothetical protein